MVALSKKVISASIYCVFMQIDDGNDKDIG